MSFTLIVPVQVSLTTPHRSIPASSSFLLHGHLFSSSLSSSSTPTIITTSLNTQSTFSTTLYTKNTQNQAVYTIRNMSTTLPPSADASLPEVITGVPFKAALSFVDDCEGRAGVDVQENNWNKSSSVLALGCLAIIFLFLSGILLMVLRHKQRTIRHLCQEVKDLEKSCGNRVGSSGSLA